MNYGNGGDTLAEDKKQLTPLEIELVKASKQVQEYKLACEANITSILWKNPDLYFTYDKLNLKSFHNNIWKVYWQIGYDIIIKENKKTLDDITVGLYLEKHPKLKQKYDEYGGYDTIDKSKEYVNIENIEGYVNELNKWNAVLQLLARRFPVHDKIKQFIDMSAEDIYDTFEAQLNHVFVNIEGDIQSYSITDGIEELIEELDEGLAVGLPFYNMPLINKETGGMLVGNITLVGGLSNVGKSTFTRSATIPSIIKEKEKIVIMLNEDGKKKWQREVLIWVANNILKKDLQKYIVRDGKYNEEVKQILYDSAKWLKEQANNHTITLIPFEKYQTAKAIKVIKKFASMGVKYFILDTFKMDAGKVTNNSWLEMQQAMVDIYDVIKPESKNIHIIITFQLAKGSAKQRYYTQDNIGVAKNIIDPSSTCIMIRDVLEDEYPDGKHEIKVYRLEGKSGKTKIPVKLDKEKKYQIVFIIKNREGSANSYQIVIEHDMSRNIMKEIGITHVSIDW
jgi:replicative DNA helicase